MVMEMALALIMKFEGFSASEYVCPAGYKSIGYGYNIEINPLEKDEFNLVDGKKQVTKDQAKNLTIKFLNKDVIPQVVKFEWFNELNDARKAVIIDMVYNLGLRSFKSFKNFIQALKDKDFDKAAYEMEFGSAPNGKSKYFNDTKLRALENIRIMKTGKIDDAD